MPEENIDQKLINNEETILKLREEISILNKNIADAKQGR